MMSRYVHVTTPHPSLKEYIQSYHMIDLPSDKIAELEFTVFPSSHTRLVLTLGEPSFQKIDQQIIKAANFSITGYYSKPHVFLPASSLRQIIVQFSPWGLQPLLDFPLADITDDRADVNEIFKHEMDDLSYRIQQKPDLPSIKQALDIFFTGLIEKKRKFDQRVMPIIPLILDTHGALRLKEIAKEACLGERTIQRMVHNNIGVSFKFFSKLVRMEYARRLLNRDDLYLTDVALQAGYFDQAHFNHEFLSTYGESPFSYQQRRHRLMWNQLESNGESVS